MHDGFDVGFRRVLFFARHEAGMMDGGTVDSEHLLLGLLREGEEALTEIFRHFEVEPKELVRGARGERTSVDRIFSIDGLELSAESEQILEHAERESKELGHPAVGSEHLLLGILHLQSCRAARLLAAQGLDLESVRGYVEQVLPWVRAVSDPRLGPNRVRERREQADLGIEALALASRLSAKTIRKVEKGVPRLSLAVALRIARGLECRVEDLFELAD